LFNQAQALILAYYHRRWREREAEHGCFWVADTQAQGKHNYLVIVLTLNSWWPKVGTFSFIHLSTHQPSTGCLLETKGMYRQRNTTLFIPRHVLAKSKSRKMISFLALCKERCSKIEE
jgi:hypothetical protein